MDFIEKLFGISPDGGSGTLEICLLAIPFILLGLKVWWTQNSGRSTQKKDKQQSA
jgi:hypothetical protein